MIHVASLVLSFKQSCFRLACLSRILEIATLFHSGPEPLSVFYFAHWKYHLFEYPSHKVDYSSILGL
jgi:hypothetical protein